MRTRETVRVTEDERGEHDIGEDSTLLGPGAADVERATGEEDSMPPVSEGTVDVPGMPVPGLGGAVHEVERQRVMHALFSTSSAAFELGRYVIAGTLGHGGMGVVFKAVDPELDRLVALKVLHTELDERHTTRLRREAQALAKLSHPNVVQVYEVGEADDRTFVAMELVKGRTLREWMRQEPRPTWRECVAVFLQVGEGLAAAHDRGLVHRDFKPGNAILDEEGRARVLDFGLARQADDDEEDPPSVQAARTKKQQAVALDVSLTKTGAVLGTPAYMPPEQMKGEEADARSDQFSFCGALWEAVYGERPFEGSSMAALMVSMMTGEVRPTPKGSTVPGTLRAVMQRGLALEPAERWPSMEVLLGELRRLLAPRRWRWLGGGLALGLAGLGTALAAPEFLAMQERRSGAQAQLEGIWDDARRQDLKAAVLGTKLSYAESTWERIEPQLDEYADAWVGKHTEVCEATTVRQEQTEDAMTLRMSCLRERRVALRATVKVLADADADTKTVENAVKLVTGLPDLGRCDDVERLAQQRQQVPPPDDPDVAEQVDQLRDRLAEVKAMQAAGQYADALVRVEFVLQRAEELDFAPLRVEAEAQQGGLLLLNGQYDEAERVLMQAHARAIALGHELMVLDVTRSLSFVVGVRLSRPDEGLVWGRTAVSLAEHMGRDAARVGSLLDLGSVLGEQGKHEEAKRHFQRALQMSEETFGDEHPRVGRALNNLASTLDILGAYAEAELHHERALHIWEKALGANHPHVAISLSGLAIVVYSQGKQDEAELHLRRASKIWERALGPEHPDVAMSLHNLGVVLGGRDKYEEATIELRRALQIRQKALGDDHPLTISTLSALGGVEQSQGNYEEARIHHERALRVGEETLGADHPELIASLDNLGLLFLEQGRLEEAKAHLHRSVLIHQKAFGEDHPEIAYSLVSLAAVALAQHDATIAREYAERAVSVREDGAVAPELIAEARFVLAQALWNDETERPRARALAERAREVLAEHGKDAEGALAEADAWLAEHPVR